MNKSSHGGNIFAVARSLSIPHEEILDFSASINPLGPAPGVGQALSASFSRLAHYPDSSCMELCEALALHHGLTPGNFCAANGSVELIYLLPHLVKGKRALVVAPPFSEYALAFAREGWETDYLLLDPAEDFNLPMERLAAALERDYELLVFGNPGNPTGRLYSSAEIESLCQLCRDAETFLVLDEAFMDFCEEGSSKQLASSEEGILILRSMTKFYALPGLRLGYAIGSHGTINRVLQLREPWSVNTPAQMAGIASLADAAYSAATREVIAAERTRLLREIADIAVLRPFPSAANYILIEILAGPTAAELARLMLEERVLIRDCGNFKGLNDRFVRVAVKSRGENDRLLRLLRGFFLGMMRGGAGSPSRCGRG